MGEPDEPRDDAPETPETPETPESASETPKASPEPEVPDAADQPTEEVNPDVIDAVEVFEAERSEEDKLREQLEAAQARLRTVSKAYTDLQNEMAAFRDRMEAQSKVKAERQAFEVVGAFLDPVQNLKRSIATPGEDLEALIGGLKLVQKQFMDALTKLGLEEVPGEGSDFNPKYHEALAVTPVADEAQDGKVLMVHQGGYVVKGKVLQAAQVVIGKHEAPAAEA